MRAIGARTRRENAPPAPNRRSVMVLLLAVTTLERFSECGEASVGGVCARTGAAHKRTSHRPAHRRAAIRFGGCDGR